MDNLRRAIFVPPLVCQLSSKWINDFLYLILRKAQGFYYDSNALILLFITGESKNSTKMSLAVALFSSAIAAVEVGHVSFSFPLSSCHHHYHSSRSLLRASCLRKNPFSRGLSIYMEIIAPRTRKSLRERTTTRNAVR